MTYRDGDGEPVVSDFDRGFAAGIEAMRTHCADAVDEYRRQVRLAAQEECKAVPSDVYHCLDALARGLRLLKGPEAP